MPPSGFCAVRHKKPRQGRGSMRKPMLHKYFYLFKSGIRKTVVFTAAMLDAGYTGITRE
jgi:hypothetical protein